MGILGRIILGLKLLAYPPLVVSVPLLLAAVQTETSPKKNLSAIPMTLENSALACDKYTTKGNTDDNHHRRSQHPLTPSYTR